MEKEIKRNSNFELLRIICMVNIIAGHMLSQTSANGLLPTDGVDYFALNFFGTGVRLSINVFVMIGAWFLVDISFNAKRFVNLWLEILFYSVLLDSMCLIFGIGDASWVWEIQAFFPIMGRPSWFGAEYLCMLLLSPFMNKCLREHIDIVKKLLLIFGVGIVGCASIFPIEHTTPFFSELVWFCFLYLFTGYIKREALFQASVIKLIGVIAFCWSVILGLKIIGDWFGNPLIKQLSIYYRNHYETIIAFAGALALFLLFKRIDIGCLSIINRIASVTFAVYIIHQTWAFYPFMWDKMYRVNEYTHSGWLTALFILIVISLYVIAMLAEKARVFIFERTIYKAPIYTKVVNYLNKFLVL